MGQTYNSLFFVTIAALISPWLSARVFRGIIPSVVVEIALGYVIGQHVFHVASSTTYISFLATFGFSYLMFLSGIELDFDLLAARQNKGAPPWVRGALFFAITLLISAVAAFVAYQFHVTQHFFIFVLLLSTTSLGIVTPALKELGWIEHDFGQEVLLFALIADVMTLIIFTAYVTLNTTGNAFSFLLVMVLLLFFVVVYRLLHLARRLTIFHVVENATSEIGVRAAFALILAFLAFSETLGTEIVIGAFLAGAIVSLLSERHSILTHKLNSLGYGFFIPIFFVHVGMQFDFQSLNSTRTFIITLVIFTLVMFLNKILPAHFIMRRFPWRVRLAGGTLLGARLSLVIAASQIANQIGLISKAYANGFILLAVITCLLSPALFTQLMRGIPLPTSKGSEGSSQLILDSKTLPTGWVVDQIEVRARALHDVPLRSLHLPHDLLVVSIVRDDERIIPRGHTRLEQFDLVQVMGTPGVLAEVRRQFQPPA